VEVAGDPPPPLEVTALTAMGDILRRPGGREALQPVLQGAAALQGHAEGADETMKRMFERMMAFMPLRSIRSFAGDNFTDEQFEALIRSINAAVNA